MGESIMNIPQLVVQLQKIWNFARFTTDPSGNLVGLAGFDTTLVQGGIPVILPPTGSFADNGALTVGTALDNTYTACFMYFPAGAIFVGSSAGRYYVVMGSTTLGTVYNNTYIAGTPKIPASPTPFVCTGAGAYTQTVGTNIFLISTEPILGGTLGANGIIEIDHLWASNNNANAKNVFVQLGVAASSAFGLANLIVGQFKDLISASGVTNNQVNFNHAPGYGTANAVKANHTTVDMTADSYVLLCANITTATDWMCCTSRRIIMRPFR
jgi:hypothetical protein